MEGKLLSARVYPEFFSFEPSDRVINLGCGKGPQAIAYAGQYREMIGVDINKKKLAESKEVMKIYGVKNYQTICANVENIPLPSNSFDKAIAIDIIEHVQNPGKLCFEANRLLKRKGRLLVTFPAMHDKFLNLVSKVKCVILKQEKKKILTSGWNPDAHNQSYPLKRWISIVESCGFRLEKSRASTLFPPLHAFGVPRFWFSNNLIHRIDSFFCTLPVLRNYGQALVCIFIKQKDVS
ncbi:MAG TPA: class I SAM-dependent methyltransferase [Candidatus Bathyarchaeia archaeon]|nr:class I SAM-dependent methyltransferase [Candidatus Bathyarchaeia archaeon]